jgi:hypothetical protein
LTDSEGAGQVLAEDSFTISLGVDRSIEEIEVAPERPGIETLVGARGGKGIRSALGEVSPAEQSSPLCLILDDVPPSGLISIFAWTQWDTESVTRPDPSGQPARTHPQIGVCSGWRPGTSALSQGRRGSNSAKVPSLADPADPLGWHHLDPHPPIAMRRARRIDVWQEGDSIVVDAMFRDGCWDRDGTEVACHEYAIDAVIDGGVLASVTATPRILPFAECPAAAPNAAWMLGVRADQLRTEVLERLRGTDCCTHLNDALRALTDVPVLAGML